MMDGVCPQHPPINSFSWSLFGKKIESTEESVNVSAHCALLASPHNCCFTQSKSMKYQKIPEGMKTLNHSTFQHSHWANHTKNNGLKIDKTRAIRTARIFAH
jgi:hypothetical protein